jgi:hypothetical protein
VYSPEVSLNVRVLAISPLPMVHVRGAAKETSGNIAAGTIDQNLIDPTPFAVAILRRSRGTHSIIYKGVDCFSK